MEKRYNYSHVFNVILLILIFVIISIMNMISINLIVMESHVQKYSYMSMFFILLVISSITRKTELIINREVVIFSYLWILYVLSILTSKFWNGEVTFTEISFYFILIPFCFYFMNFENIKRIVYLAVAFASVVAIYSFQVNNSTGMILALSGVALIHAIDQKITSKLSVPFVFCLFSILIWQTGSRTSLLSFVLFCSTYIISQKKYTFRINYKHILNTLILVPLVIFILYKFTDTLQNFFLNKWGEQSVGNVSSGRIEMWKYTLSGNYTFLGNGDNYFYETFKIGDAHNIFLQNLGVYGWLSFSLFTIMILFLLRLSFKVDKLIFSYFIFYISIGFAENILIFDSRFLAYNIMFLFNTVLLLRKSMGKGASEIWA